METRCFALVTKARDPAPPCCDSNKGSRERRFLNELCGWNDSRGFYTVHLLLDFRKRLILDFFSHSYCV